MTQSFNCPSCGAPIDVDPGDDPVVRCPYCANTVVIPAELRSPAHSAPQVPASIERFGDVSQLGARVLEILELARRGQKLHAIQRFRETFGGGLKEARDAVEALERGESIELKRIETTNEARAGSVAPDEFARRIRELLEAGKKIEAIKIYRQATNAGLKESKDAIDAFEAGGPLAFPDPGQQTTHAMVNKVASLGRAASLVQAGERDEAARVYREAFDVSQAEAEAAIDAIAAGDFEKVAEKALHTPYIALVRPPLAAPREAVVRTFAAVGAGTGCFVWSLATGILLITLLPILFAFTRPGGPLFESWSRINPFSPARVTMAFGEQGTGPGRFTDPRFIAVENSSGRIYVGEYSGGQIKVFDRDGEFITQWTAGDRSGHLAKLAVDRQGIVYAVKDGEILRYAADSGEYLGAAAVPLELQDEVYFDDLAVTPDGGLAAVSRGETVLRFDGRGQLTLTIPAAVSSVSGDSELTARVAADGLGNIYLLGIFNDAVFKYSPRGGFITRFGTVGDEPGQFRAPSAIAVDNRGRVYVSDFKGVQVFDPDGRYLDVIPVDGFAFGLAIDDEDQLFVVTNSPRVLRMSIRSSTP